MTNNQDIVKKIVIDFNKTGYITNQELKTTDLAAVGVSTLIKPLLFCN